MAAVAGIIRCAALSILLMAVAGPALGTTYHYEGPTYNVRTGYTEPCSGGPCADYAFAMRVSGSFTTAAPLAPNLSKVDIVALVTSYTFSDGIHTYSSSNGSSWLVYFDASTNASGVPTAAMFVDIATWITGATPHKAGDRFSEFFIDGSVDAQNNATCSGVGPKHGVTDACVTSFTDTSTSFAFSQTGVWTISLGEVESASIIPTLSEW